MKAQTPRLPDTENGSVTYVNLLENTIHDGDFEGFVQIAELNARIPEPVSLADLASEYIFLLKDRAKLLDEYIRRTGQGIDIPQKKNEDELQRPKGREYWGLNVHGKKRRDLTGDPNRRYNTGSKIPLVWSAAQSGALEVLDYLSTDRPLAAYQYYLSRNPKESKNVDLQTLENSISELLGWCSNPSNESPLSATLQSGKMDAFRKLLELKPTLLKPCLHKR